VSVASEHTTNGARETFEVMMTMRAMRRLRPDPVPDELLSRLVELAGVAPSAGNAQAYEFIVVTDRQKMASLAVLWRRCVDVYTSLADCREPQPNVDRAAQARVRAAVAYQRDHFHETPALIVPCYLLDSPGSGLAELRALAPLGVTNLARLVASQKRLNTLTEAASVYLGVQNLLLGARALGLAANITMWHLLIEHEWKAALNVPHDVHTFAVVPIGWPLGRFGAVQRRPHEEAIHWQSW
jgi:nitroreductase